MYQSITVAHIDPAKKADVLAAGEVLAAATRKQHGNISYNIFQQEDRDDMLVIVESWETQEDFFAHVAHGDEEDDPVHAFGEVINPASTMPPDLFKGTVLV